MLFNDLVSITKNVIYLEKDFFCSIFSNNEMIVKG